MILERAHGGAKDRLARRRLQVKPIGFLMLDVHVLKGPDVDAVAVLLLLRGVVVVGHPLEAGIERVVVEVDVVRFYLFTTTRLYLLGGGNDTAYDRTI